MNKENEDKDKLIRALITKMCETGERTEVRWDKDFLGDNALLLKKISERGRDLPSVKFLEDTYKFKSEKTEYTLTDLMEKINLIYYKDQSAIILKELIAGRKNGIDASDINDSLDGLYKKFGTLRSILTNAQAVDIANEPDKVADEYRKLKEGLTLVPTGFTEIDENCKFALGSLILFTGVTGAGKSLLMTFMQKVANEKGISSLYISLEMSLIEVATRLVLAKGICNADDLDKNKITPEQYKQYIQQLKDTNTHILTRTTESKINIQTIERYITELKPKVVFLDYMTLLQDADFSWNSEVSVSAELKRLALQYNVLIITAVQADTASMTSGDVPDLHNVRGNKGVSYDANVVIGFASERKLTDPEIFRFRFSIRKNRNGPILDFAYELNPRNGMLRNITENYFAGL